MQEEAKAQGKVQPDMRTKDLLDLQRRNPPSWSEPLDELSEGAEGKTTYEEEESSWQQYAVLRWSLYQALFLAFGLLLKNGVLDRDANPVLKERDDWTPYEIINWSLAESVALVWVLIFTLPAVWVWRKAISKPIRHLIGFLNNAAD